MNIDHIGLTKQKNLMWIVYPAGEKAHEGLQGGIGAVVGMKLGRHTKATKFHCILVALSDEGENGHRNDDKSNPDDGKNEVDKQAPAEKVEIHSHSSTISS
jgi:hypothetical protein